MSCAIFLCQAIPYNLVDKALVKLFFDNFLFQCVLDNMYITTAIAEKYFN